MACFICTIDIFTEDDEPICASYSLVDTIQDDVDKAIKAIGSVQLMFLQNTLTMIAHTLLCHPRSAGHHSTTV